MSVTFPSGMAGRDAKVILLDLCRSSSSAQNLERIVRGLLAFWDHVKCALVLDTDLVSEIFSSLRYAPENVENSDLSSFSQLDVKVFLHLCVHCAHVRSERIKEKPGTFSSVAATDQLTSDRQRVWWRAAWSLCHGVGKQEDRIRLQEGLECVRLKSRDVPELPLLVSVAAMLENEVPDVYRYNGNSPKAVAASDYAKLYWNTINDIWERDRIVPPKADSLFYAGLSPLPRSRRDHYRSLAKYYRALNALMHEKVDECVSILEGMQTPLAYFALAQIYKQNTQNVGGRQSDGDAQVRRRAMLLKARDALRSAMNKFEDHATAGVINEVEIMRQLDEIEESLAASNLALVPTNGETPRQQQQSDSSGFSVTPLTPSTAGYFTPAGRFMPARTGPSNAAASAPASLLLELGQSVDYALRSLTQSQETLVRGILEQNRSLTTTCDNMIVQMKELTLTNRTLVDEMKEMRRENADYRGLMSALESVRGRSNVADESNIQYAPYPQQLPSSVAIPVYTQQYQQPIQPPMMAAQPPLLASSQTPLLSSQALPLIAQTNQRHQRFPTLEQTYGFNPENHPQSTPIEPMFPAAKPQLEPTAPPAKPPSTHTEAAFPIAKPQMEPTFPAAKPQMESTFPTTKPQMQPAFPVAKSQGPPMEPSLPPSNKPQLSTLDMFKPKPGSWACDGCYTRNDATASHCIACGTQGPAAVSQQQQSKSSVAPPVTTSKAPLMPAPTATSFSWLAPSAQSATSTPSAAVTTTKTAPITTSASVAVTLPLFGTSTPVNTSFSSAQGTPASSTPSTTATALATRPIFGMSNPASMPSFASLAKEAVAPSFQPFQGFKGFGDIPDSQIFGKVVTSTPQRARQESEHDDGESAEHFEPTIEFKPVVPLPALVETKSGEEEEEVLFRERAKLYRWDQESKAFKERGVGDMKILKHPETGAIRVLMRREQILKLCANHRIMPGMKLSAMQKSDRAFTWNCQDYADGELKSETVAAKFKDPTAAQKFKEAFESAANESGSAEKRDNTQQTPPSASGKAHESGDGAASDDDISFVYQVEVNNEDAAKAAQLELPKTFFVQRPCAGCIGCASDEVQDRIFSQLDRRVE